MRKALAIAKTFALFSIRQLLENLLVKRILYTRYEHLAVTVINIFCIVIAFILGYGYGVELFLNPWEPNILVDTIFAFLFVISLIAFTFSPVKGLGLPPGYEFLLHQPIDFYELIIGIALGFILQSLAVFMLMAFIPLIIFFFDVALGLAMSFPRFIASFILLLMYVTVCYMPFTLVLDVTRTLLLRGKGGYSLLPIQVLTFVYIFVGISHSVILSIDSAFPMISPILALPIKSFYIISFEISRFIGFVCYILGLLMIFGVYYALLRYVSSFLSMEDFISIKDVYEIRLAKQLERELKRRPLVSWASPEEVLRQVLVDLSPLNPRNNLKRYTIAFSVIICIAFILRTVFMKMLPIMIEYLGAFLGSIIGVSIMFVYMPLVNELLFNDLKFLWILKVYSCDDLPFIKILNIKYLSYLGIVMTIISLFISIVLQNFYLMFLPLLNLPYICLSVNLFIIFGVKYLRRRKGKPLTFFGATGSAQLDIYATVLMIPILPPMIGLSFFASLIAGGLLVGINFVLALTTSILVFILLSLLLIKWVAYWLTEVELY